MTNWSVMRDYIQLSFKEITVEPSLVELYAGVRDEAGSRVYHSSIVTYKDVRQRIAVVENGFKPQESEEICKSTVDNSPISPLHTFEL